MLGDIVVIDAGTRTSSAYCGKLLVDAGATVYRLECRTGATTSHGREAHSDGYAAYLHAGKKLVSLPLDGSLAERVDVVIHDGIINDAAFDAALSDLRARRDDLVVVSLSDYGLDGPRASTPATELTLQAEAGVVALHPTYDLPPVGSGVELAEITTGVCAATAAVMGLFARDAGERQVEADLSRFEALIAIMQYPWLFAQFPHHFPYPVPQNAVPGIEQAKDGWVCVVCLTPQQWSDFKKLADAPELDDPRFDAPGERIRLGPEITGHVRDFTGRYTVDELVRLGAENRVPIVPVGTPVNVAELPPYASRDAYVRDETGVMSPRPPFRLQVAPPEELGEGVTPKPLPRRAKPRSSRTAPWRPLEGLRVVEFGTFQAGPLATATLASLGADVIKVESGARPDLIRFTGSPPTADRFWERSAGFAGVNLGKRAIAVDLSNERGREIIRKLILSSDIVVENYSPRVLESWGLGYEDIRRIRSDIIMMRMPAWGLTGPWRDWPGFTYTANAASGLATVTGHPDGEPLLTGTVIDPIAGFLAAFVLLGAIRMRQHTGRGALIEVPLCDVAAQLTARSVIDTSHTGQVAPRRGNRNSAAAPVGVYRCADDVWLAISITGDQQWKSLSALDRADRPTPWALDARFAHLDGRLRHHELLDQHLSELCATRTAAELTHELRAIGVAAAAVVTGADAIDHPQLLARGRVFEVDHPVIGPARYIGHPMRFSHAPDISVPRPAPLLGQHNSEILAELGYQPADIEGLAVDKVVAAAPHF